MTKSPAATKGKTLVERWDVKGHNPGRCPQCKRGVLTIGLPLLVYTFESCECKAEDFAHLVETLWHRECFRKMS